MNLGLGIISIIITFSIPVIMEKKFQKEGLYVWISIATIIANILVCKSIELFHYTTNLGNILFASSFLAGDILNEKYSKRDSKQAVLLAVIAQIVFIIMTQMALQYIPSKEDLAQESMKTLFQLNIRVSISSIIMYFISNYANIYIYNRIKEKVPKKLWLRNNISTIISNSLENYLFTTFAFIGIFSIKTIVEIATIASILEIILAILDKPFLYLAVKGRNYENSND